MRLIPMSDDDVALRIRLETDPEVMRHLGGPRPVADIERAHASAMREARSGDCWALLFIAEGETSSAGWICVFRRGDDPRWEIGWMTLPEHQGRGLATEAVRLVLERARAEARFGELYAYPAADNPASNRICEKCGFELIGRVDVDQGGHLLHCNAWRVRLLDA